MYPSEIYVYSWRYADLRQLTLTVGDRELLSDAHLRLFTGVKYGLVGANGVGKYGPHPQSNMQMLVS